jgi:preprotein translocase subunit SecG
MAILLPFVLAIYVIVALLMILVILMQRPKSEGLGAAFGGGVTENIFGAQTTNVLTKITGWLAGIFFVLTFTLSILYAHRANATSGLRRELEKSQPAAAVPGALPPGVTIVPEAPQPAGIAPATEPLPQTDAAASPPSPADMAVGAVQPIPAPAVESSAAPVAPSAQPSP